MSVLANAAAVVSAKGAIGLTVAVLAIGGASTEAAITGSANPEIWGQQVVTQVQTCKAALTPGSHGLGKCVSTFAKTHGKQVSADHRASGARQSPPSHPTGPPTSHPGQPTDHPGQPTGHPDQPSDHPGGRPSSNP